MIVPEHVCNIGRQSRKEVYIVERTFRVRDRVRVSKGSLPGYPEAMRLGWVLGVMEDDGMSVTRWPCLFPTPRGLYWCCPPTR